MHVFNLKPGSFEGTGDYCHQSTSRNGWIAREPTASRRRTSSSTPGARSSATRPTATASATSPTTAPPSPTPARPTPIPTGIGDVCDPTPRGTIPPTITVAGPHRRRDRPRRRARQLHGDRDRRPRPASQPRSARRPSGSLFAIGNTPLACSATDASGNAANASFVVKVLGAKEQLTNLIGKVVGATNLPPAVKAQLTASLQSLAAGFDPSKPLQRAARLPYASSVHHACAVRDLARAGGRMDRRRQPHQGRARLLTFRTKSPLARRADGPSPPPLMHGSPPRAGSR